MSVSWSVCVHLLGSTTWSQKTPTALKYIKFSFRLLHYWWKVALKAEAASMRYWAFLAFHLHFILFSYYCHSPTVGYKMHQAKKSRTDSDQLTPSILCQPKNTCLHHVSLPPTGAASPCPQSSSLPWKKKLTRGVRSNASSFSVGNNHILEQSCHATKLDSAWACVCVVNPSSVYRKSHWFLEVQGPNQ